MNTEETISRVKSSLQATKSFLALEVIEQLEKENAELKENHESDKRSLSLIVDKGLKLEEQIKEMKNDLFNVANKNTQAERLSAFWDMYHKYLD